MEQVLTTLAPDMLTTLVSATAAVNATDAGGPTAPARSGSRIFLIVIKVVYAIGIAGNAAAILILRRGERRMRNRKHLLLLTSLAVNDLVALVGMVCALVVSEQLPWARSTRLYCAARVLLRVFGVGSVCIAVTMALERYLALTRPFLYQKQVTYYVIRTALLVSWFWAAVLTCAPIFGFGLYYDEATHTCTRYRNATATTDFVYAVFYVLFGTLLCVVLVYCNLAVIRALYAISAPSGGGTVVRRVSRSSCRQRSQHSVRGPDGEQSRAGPPLHYNAATAEEVAFSRLMATLSVLFMICWLPQMVTSALYLSLGAGRWTRLSPLAQASDLLMLLNYVLDPLLYVLLRRRRLRPARRPAADCGPDQPCEHSCERTCRRARRHPCSPAALGRALAACFKRNHKTSTESMKTSCCPQETLLVSDSSGAEARPLRALGPAPLVHTAHTAHTTPAPAPPSLLD